jgi:hypothetical protein
MYYYIRFCYFLFGSIAWIQSINKEQKTKYNLWYATVKYRPDHEDNDEKNNDECVIIFEI